MLVYITALIILSLALVGITLRKAYYFFPAKELKRQARHGDPAAKTLYRAVAYGSSLRLLLWIIIGLSIAASCIILIDIAPAWIVFIAVLGLVGYAFAWAPHAPVSGVGLRLVLVLTPFIAWVLYYVHPLLDRVARLIDRFRTVTIHTGLFERQDLIDLLERQRAMHESRISDAELNLAIHSLSFGDKLVHSVMVPRKSVKMVAETDVIGPILMDELYESGFDHFPVRLGIDMEVTGTLHLRDLLSTRHGEMVRDVMKHSINYVHEDQSLYQVLNAFLKTKHHLFIVINSHEEFVGIISIEDVLEQIIGQRLDEDFDKYDDRRSIADSGVQTQPPAFASSTDKGDIERTTSETDEQQ